MARIQLIAMLAKATGKVFGRNCDMWLMERYGTKYTARLAFELQLAWQHQTIARCY
mgnify:CR=1 FL=1